MKKLLVNAYSCSSRGAYLYKTNMLIIKIFYQYPFLRTLSGGTSLIWFGLQYEIVSNKAMFLFKNRNYIFQMVYFMHLSLLPM